MPPRALNEFPPHRPIILNNATCPYCGVLLDGDTATKEHVIGRRFVPRGTLNGKWNLIVNACRECNGHKSNLEDDISAISMRPNAVGRTVRSEEAFISEAARKAAGSLSRRTGKPVVDSSETFDVEAILGPGVRMKATLRTQPQADAERIFELAQFQASAFFYFVTYDDARRRGGFWLGGFFPLLFSFRDNWGNTAHRAFMNAVVKWEPRVLGGTADGLFKVAIRRNPDAQSWSWAFEWNENIRAVGFFGEEPPVTATVEQFPAIQRAIIPQPDGSHVGVRAEVALAAQDDYLFSWANETPNPSERRHMD